MAKGDQIYVMRHFLTIQGVYEHHGIDCGDETVIHYRKTGEAEIARTSMSTFTQGTTVYVKRYPTSFVPDAVISRAESRLGERKYNLLFNNCEHFATWCKTGVNHSQQVKDFLPLIGTMNVEELEQPIAQALRGGDPSTNRILMDRALADVKVAWDSIQPQYNQARKDMNDWNQVALRAVKQGRDDLARAALQRKLAAKKRANDLQAHLEQLATLTETITRNFNPN